MNSPVYEELSKENYLIAIPSRERTDLIKSCRGIWKYLYPYDQRYPVILAIRGEEERDYFNAMLELEPESKLDPNPVLMCTESENMNIAKTRQLILEHADDNGIEYLFMIDDDVVISYRDESLSSKYGSKVEPFIERDGFNKLLLESIRLCGPEYPMVGLPLRFGSVSRKYTFEKNSTIIRFVCLHVPTLMKEGISYTGLDGGVMEDYFVQLSLLEKGYKTMTNCRYAIDDYGTGKPGGCSSTRTKTVHDDSAIKLARRFEGRVQLKSKRTTFWQEERLDCSFQPKGFLPSGEAVYVPVLEAIDKFNLEFIRGEYV